LNDLLLEIGTEEIPARFIEPAKEGLLRLLSEGLTHNRIPFTSISIHGTPRRLAALVSGVAAKQDETTTVKFGPPANRAFDESGAPTKAAAGFAKSQGVAVEDLRRGIKDGVEFLTIEKLESGRTTEEVLPGLLKDALARIPFQKRMRWGTETFEYARPIQWLLVLLGAKPIDFAVADVVSGKTTYGHRFLSSGPVTVDDPSGYRDLLRRHSVIVDEEERLAIIRRGVAAIEAETGGRAIDDEALVREILYITEFPYPLKGAFEEAFLVLPKEVLVNVMKSHQRYIPLESSGGALLPYFIFFANTAPTDPAVVVKGNEKVLRARLADARFFFDEDRKTPLISLYDRLQAIVYHVKLGTLKEKVDRVEHLSGHLARLFGFGDLKKVERAARIAKTDLLTHMVGEFSELQGVMGRIYAGHQGEDAEVATAIEEHYLPTGPDSDLPQTAVGTIVGIADKADSLVSFFSVGVTPTGNLDPYALRRQALGIIRIAIDKGIHIPLGDLITASYESGASIRKRLSLEETKAAVADFLATRFKFAMLDGDRNQDFIEAVLPFVAVDIFDGYRRLRALETQKSLEDFSRLMVGFKRVFNITKQLSGPMAVDPSLFAFPQEEALFALCRESTEPFHALMAERRYEEALAILVGFKETVDGFFDKVFVMDKDEAIKNNRLALLKAVKDLFLTFGDFSKIRIE
jgi:glycyl-tRNA synthetase beta chain